jgi:aminopeptidase N
MFRIYAGIFLCLTVFAPHLVAQRFKLYKDFGSESNVDRFNNNKEGISYRLPNETYPLRYDIELTTRIDQAIFTFTGRVQILLHVKEATNSITLHSKMNRIISTTLLDNNENIINTLPPQLDPITEFLVVNVVGLPLVAGANFTLAIVYDGELRSAQEAEGFYRSSYLSATGETM